MNSLPPISSYESCLWISMAATAIIASALFVMEGITTSTPPYSVVAYSFSGISAVLSIALASLGCRKRIES